MNVCNIEGDSWSLVCAMRRGPACHTDLETACIARAPFRSSTSFDCQLTSLHPGYNKVTTMALFASVCVALTWMRAYVSAVCDVTVVDMLADNNLATASRGAACWQRRRRSARK